MGEEPTTYPATVSFKCRSASCQKPRTISVKCRAEYLRASKQPGFCRACVSSNFYKGDKLAHKK